MSQSAVFQIVIPSPWVCFTSQLEAGWWGLCTHWVAHLSHCSVPLAQFTQPVALAELLSEELSETGSPKCAFLLFQSGSASIFGQVMRSPLEREPHFPTLNASQCPSSNDWTLSSPVWSSRRNCLLFKTVCNLNVCEHSVYLFRAIVKFLEFAGWNFEAVQF